MVHEVIEADPEEEDAVVFPPHEAFCDAQVDVEDAALVERVARESGGTGGDRVRAPVLNRSVVAKSVDRAGLPAEITGAISKVFTEVLQPHGRADVVERQLKDATGDDTDEAWYCRERDPIQARVRRD